MVSIISEVVLILMAIALAIILLTAILDYAMYRRERKANGKRLMRVIR